ncbi:unnamed protein product [Mytilus coruscus]|uniref:Fibrinogen C-terminal domain-containing protein n=1 Tax=Mytilus coruscus TaxID=42192 RepID=A0A6J8CKS8_MYTCO|nr:unnamed protein product [Mytilus coruscus]
MEAIKENVKDFVSVNINDEIRKIVEEILKEKGNEYINAISTNGQHKVKFTLWKDGTTKYTEYSNFRVEDEQSKYKLKVSGYSGTAGESLVNVLSARKANEQKFSTYDQDNDGISDYNCAMENKGGWWYNACFYASLNNMENNRINWYKDMGYNIKKSMVMVTRK